MVTIVLDKKIIKSEKGKFYTVSVGDASTIFVSKELYDKIKVDSKCTVVKSRYRNSDGNWRTSTKLSVH